MPSPKPSSGSTTTQYCTQYTLSCLSVDLVESSATLVFLCLPSSLSNFLLMLVMQLYSGQLVCFRQLLLLGTLSSSLSMFISHVRGDVIAVERNIPTCHKSRISNINKNTTIRCNEFIFSCSYDEYKYLWN